MSSGQGTAGPDDRFPASLIKLPAASSYHGRDHVLSAAALWLHLRAAAASVADDHPGLVPGEYLGSLTGKDLYSPGDDPAALAAELCTAGLWERAGGGYRILDGHAIREFTGKVRELREKGNRAAQATVTRMTRAGTTVDMGPPLGCETYDRDASSWITSSARPAGSPTRPPWTRSRRSSAATRPTRCRCAGSTRSWHRFSVPIAG